MRAWARSNSLSEHGRTCTRSLTIAGAIAAGRPCDHYRSAQLRAHCHLRTVLENEGLDGHLLGRRWARYERRVLFPRNCIVQKNGADSDGVRRTSNGTLPVTATFRGLFPKAVVVVVGDHVNFVAMNRRTCGRCRQPGSRRR